MTESSLSINNSFQQEEDGRWRNMNVSVKTPLLERLDSVVESDLPFDSRSKFIRQVLREKLSEIESNSEEHLDDEGELSEAERFVRDQCENIELNEEDRKVEEDD